MKKLLIGSLAAIYLTGCCDDSTTQETKYTKGETFTIIDKQDPGGNNRFYVIRDEETGVNYFIWDGNKAGAITPLYNTDGTLKIN